MLFMNQTRKLETLWQTSNRSRAAAPFKIALQITGVTVVVLTITSLAKADDSKSLATLKAEKAALEERLGEINTRINKLSGGHEASVLGVMLVDPTQELLNKYNLSPSYPGPIMVQVQDPSYFPKGMAPYEGCAFWLVEHPSKAFSYNGNSSQTHYPTTIRELAEAIVACTVAPEEYQRIYDDSRKTARDYAEKMKDQPAERERMLRIADEKLTDDAVGKYVCRVVYNYPAQKGTMTTELRMTKVDLDHLRELAKK